MNVSNQFFADLELSMQPKRDATDKVIKAAHAFININAREINYNTHSLEHKAALEALNIALGELEEVDHPTHFCRMLKPGPLDYWTKNFPKLDFPHLCNKPAFYNNYTRCIDHRER